MLDRTGTNFSNLNYIFWPWFNHIHTYKHCFLWETHTLSHPFHNKNKGEKNKLFPSIKTNAWLIGSNFVYFSIDQIIFFSSSHNVQQIKTHGRTPWKCHAVISNSNAYVIFNWFTLMTKTDKIFRGNTLWWKVLNFDPPLKVADLTVSTSNSKNSTLGKFQKIHQRKRQENLQLIFFFGLCWCHKISGDKNRHFIVSPHKHTKAYKGTQL